MHKNAYSFLTISNECNIYIYIFFLIWLCKRYVSTYTTCTRLLVSNTHVTLCRIASIHIVSHQQFIIIIIIIILKMYCFYYFWEGEGKQICDIRAQFFHYLVEFRLQEKYWYLFLGVMPFLATPTFSDPTFVTQLEFLYINCLASRNAKCLQVFRGTCTSYCRYFEIHVRVRRCLEVHVRVHQFFGIRGIVRRC